MPFVAHQGGWDEALILGLPLLIYLYLRMRDRRAGGDAPSDEERPRPPED